ncbi:solute carrier family 23 protein [Streptomyces sp. NPDC056255]|uniref:solute carrier family 23 protein n=1 Tax=Streptomyces sp. NPDC056255 TaxID=3345764 RepID=UPI0035DC7A0B
MGASWHGAPAVAADRAPVGPNPPGRPARQPACPACPPVGPSVSRPLAAVPEPVVGAAGLIIYAVIATTGFGMLSRENLSHGTNGIVVALALCVGLLPVFAPEMYAGLPVWARTVFGSGVAAWALAAVVLAAVFGRLGPKEEKPWAEPAKDPVAGAEVGSAP